ncbi:MAG: type II toxin-antitoxin system RelE/ParE family toxin [Bacteroidia bacterium]|nr:type II toxin-antitoxin system RelE/ParE family toxin [Bacteroidia bacterium]
MAKVIFRQQAIDDLNSIWNYTYDEWSEMQADKYYASLEFACFQIGENPELGKKYEEIKNNLLGLRTGKHIVFYQIVNDEKIEIIRILHEGMDLIKRLNE